MTLIDNLPAAVRLARALISDINVYAPEKVAEGIEFDTLFEVLHEELEQAEAHYRGRVTKELWHHFGRAINDVLLLPRAGDPSPLWG